MDNGSEPEPNWGRMARQRRQLKPSSENLSAGDSSTSNVQHQEVNIRSLLCCCINYDTEILFSRNGGGWILQARTLKRLKNRKRRNPPVRRNQNSLKTWRYWTNRIVQRMRNQEQAVLQKSGGAGESPSGTLAVGEQTEKLREWLFIQERFLHGKSEGTSTVRKTNGYFHAVAGTGRTEECIIMQVDTGADPIGQHGEVYYLKKRRRKYKNLVMCWTVQIRQLPLDVGKPSGP